MAGDAWHLAPLTDGDRPWAAEVLTAHWGSPMIVTRGRVYDAARLPGFVATSDGERFGLVTYHLTEGACQIVSLNSLAPGRGIGSALVEAVRRVAAAAGSQRLWLITTNDNLAALRFYQRRGATLAALYPGALELSRMLKPGIPALGIDGIPLRDEIEVEWRLTRPGSADGPRPDEGG